MKLLYNYGYDEENDRYLYEVHTKFISRKNESKEMARYNSNYFEIYKVNDNDIYFGWDEGQKRGKYITTCGR